MTYNDLKTLMDFLRLRGTGAEKRAPEDARGKRDGVWSDGGEL